MNNKKKIRIQYKNIVITYNNCFEVELKDFKAFFIDLFQETYKNNSIKYLLIVKNKIEKYTKVLLLLDKKPDWKNIDNFIFQDNKPLFEISNSPKTFIEEIKEDKDNEWLEIGNLSKNLVTASNKTPKEEWQAFIEFIKDLREEFKLNKAMTTLEVTLRIDQWLDNENSNLPYTNINKIEQIIHKHFLRPEDPTKNMHIYDIRSFKHDNEDIKNLKKMILQQLETLKKPGGRPKAIVIEGETRIGKTHFIISFLQSINVKFNLMKKNFNFSRRTYSDDKEVDLCDDIDMFKVRSQEAIESMTACSQASVNVPSPDKFEKSRTLIKNHLVIFLCNGHSSFQKFINKTTDIDLKKYLEDNLIIYQMTSNEKLYKDSEEEEKNRIYQNAIKPNENRETLKNVAMELFGKDKTEVID